MKKNIFCLVGFGNHAESKILPVLEHQQFKIAGIVTKKNIPKFKYNKYKSLKSALNNVPKKTIFILCSPPNVHFRQAKEILENKFSLIIEKPIFIYTQELDQIIKKFNGKNFFFTESLMYNYSKQYKEFKKIWRKNKKLIKKIKIYFTIPSFPEKSFRNNETSFPINLYDIGCYPLNLIHELGLNLKLENIKIINYQDRKKELFEIRFINNNLIVEIKFGISRSYKNFVSFDLQNKESYQFKPFFYGRPGKRIIKYKKGEKAEIKKIDESNSFETLFKQQPSVWINSQEKRNKVVRKKLTDLEYIWKIYKNYNK